MYPFDTTKTKTKFTSPKLPLATKLDTGKSSMILTQQRWKLSPEATGVDSDEHDRESVDKQKRKLRGGEFRTEIRLLLTPLT